MLDSGTQQSSVIEEKDCEYERVKSELIEKPKYLHGYEELKIPNGTVFFSLIYPFLGHLEKLKMFKHTVLVI